LNKYADREAADPSGTFKSVPFCLYKDKLFKINLFANSMEGEKN
jgi:hypothetical protein